MSELSSVLFKTSTDLVFDDGIPEVVREIAHGDRVPFVLCVPPGVGTFE